MMEWTLGTLACIAGVVLAVSAEAAMPDPPDGGQEIAIVPRPLRMDVTTGYYTLASHTRLLVEPGSAEVRGVADYLARTIRHGTGYQLPASYSSEARAQVNAMLLTTKGADPSLGAEGYELVVALDSVVLRAPTPHGLFLGVQTLRQLLPAAFEKGGASGPWRIPCVVIYDKPQYQWRGMLLDCGRHFMTKEFVKRYIDLLAYHKMNTLHWHLTEDQGWRIEIKKYPRLTEVGAWRGPERYGGYYSQDDVREIVAYAKSRYVNIVPEIEMPGHSMAALASYPQLSCTGGPFEVANRWGVFRDVYCAGNDDVFRFLQEVLDEVIALFPFQYIHIGGDECPKDRWKQCERCQARIKNEGLKDEHELQSYFIKRIEKYLLSRKRRLIGWDEILEGGLAPNATVQWWRGIENAVQAAKQGHDVIASPTSHCYIDYSIDTIDLERIYSFNPTPDALSPEEAKHILGGECNMWTEHAPQETVDSKVFPRLCGLAEALWLPLEKKSWPEFAQRMMVHGKRLTDMGVQVGPGMPDLVRYEALLEVACRWTPEQMSESWVDVEWDVTRFVSAPGTYEVELRYERGAHGIAIESVSLLAGDRVVVQDAHEGWSGAEKRDNRYTLVVERAQPDTTYILRVRLRSDGGTDSSGTVHVGRLRAK
jgi:hexosaminidase